MSLSSRQIAEQISLKREELEALYAERGRAYLQLAEDGPGKAVEQKLKRINDEIATCENTIEGLDDARDQVAAREKEEAHRRWRRDNAKQLRRAREKFDAEAEAWVEFDKTLAALEATADKALALHEEGRQALKSAGALALVGQRGGVSPDLTGIGHTINSRLRTSSLTRIPGIDIKSGAPGPLNSAAKAFDHVRRQVAANIRS